MQFEEIAKRLGGGAAHSLHVARSGPATRARLAKELIDQGRSVVLVARNADELAELRALATLFSPDESSEDVSLTVPAWERRWIIIPQHPAGSPGRTAWAARMASLYALNRRHMPQAVIVSLDNFIPKLPPPSLFDKHQLVLSTGEDMSPGLVMEQAVEWGYTRTAYVTQPGEIALRGDILDIFPPGYAKPVRLDFFGDTLEEIRLFDPSSQRSKGNLAEVTLIPTAPVVLEGAPRAEARSFWQRAAESGLLPDGAPAALDVAAGEARATLLPGVYYQDAVFLERWLPPDAVYILPAERDVAEALKQSARTWDDFSDQQEREYGIHQPAAMTIREAEDVTALFGQTVRVYFEELVMGVEQKGENLPERGYEVFQDLFYEKEQSDRPWQTLIEALKEWSRTRRQTVLSFGSARSRAKFLSLAQQDGISPYLRYDKSTAGVFALVSAFRKGAELQWDNSVVLGEDVLQPRTRQQRVRSGAFAGLKSYDDLEAGAMLVHRDYGVARFEGLLRMDLGGVSNDYLLLRYAGDDKLYLPVDRLSLVQRFKGPDGTAPSLDKLGGAGWSASKSKARKAIERIAHDLVEMYAWRKVAKGYRYSPVNDMYREFEASFGFEETPDQARAIEDVLDDMERAEPMDRLVCGDVGFGKTEVALRAAFRAAMDGKQVALLCPTTVLAEQHFQTFRSRLGQFPVNVGMLSRFVSRQRQKEVLAACERGQIDILIGTHRILSDDVILPNLSLLILDEEQRFGVRHKERLKKMRRNVDVLTLTATPIPRTLQLSMSGIRELSVIETAPPERKPVKTALIDRDPDILREVLLRELQREGQVFWVHNRVQGLERVAEYVRSLVPDARVGMAHGQMSEKALEETMHKFWHAELDVLVCTAIVESGLDFPRANTLVVDQAQMFGLGQLYQLRGRVGRSDRQAHAVFVVPDVDGVPELARKRLKIILEMDYLGAGFQVAMEDLRLRGAGNILGEVQSGHMVKIGLDMYLEMLEEEVARLKGEPVRDDVQTELNIGITAHIPEGYMDDGRERLKYYKALSSAADGAAQESIELEMRDRFGHFPQELQAFLGILRLKRYLGTLDVQKADIFADKVRLTWAENAGAVSPATLVGWVAERAGRARLVPPAIMEIQLPEGSAFEDRLSALQSELELLRAQ
ncbi:transcription-repair coupling factor [Oleidesulfovibrio alaskensis]|uniref:transcription-repair coupling factor n=1 Tax=Oleidesulfovibrio alaskensis TaxID=58180 RepID=UPI0003FF6555|nr:transcription-repair coupling factor [Oleidesulfovibrio alaskensis]